MALGGLYKRLVVAGDTRTSTAAMKNAVMAGLEIAGAHGFDAGVAPTPTLAMAAADCDAGVMITASHNPPEYNGIKLVNPDGSAFSPAQQGKVEDIVAKGSLSAVNWMDFGESGNYRGAVERHVDRIIADFGGVYDIKVMVDCGCGAASVITPDLLKKMGCGVTHQYCYPRGYFPRATEPTEANLAELIKEVKKNGAALGIAHDGDADRMMAVDDKGNFIPGDKLMAIFANEAGAKDVVTTVDASMAIDECGFNVYRTPVGDNSVSWRLKESGDFGGEPSGSWVFPEISLCPDGIYAAARLVEIASRKRLSELVKDLPEYPLLRGSVPVVADMTVIEKEMEMLNPISVDTMDGIKLNFKDGWLLVRPSGTEPKMRLTAEAHTGKRAKELYETGQDIIKKAAMESVRAR